MNPAPEARKDILYRPSRLYRTPVEGPIWPVSYFVRAPGSLRRLGTQSKSVKTVDLSQSALSAGAERSDRRALRARWWQLCALRAACCSRRHLGRCGSSCAGSMHVVGCMSAAPQPPWTGASCVVAQKAAISARLAEDGSTNCRARKGHPRPAETPARKAPHLRAGSTRRVGSGRARTAREWGQGGRADISIVDTSAAAAEGDILNTQQP